MPLSNHGHRNHGKEIGDIVRSALQSGDLSRLSQLGPAVQEAVKDIPGVQLDARDDAQPPAPRAGQPQQGKGRSSGHPYYEPQYKRPPTLQYRRPAWQGSGAPARTAGANMPGGVVRIVFGVLGMVAFGLAMGTFLGLAAMLPGQGGLFYTLGQIMGFAFAGSGVLLGTGIGANRFKNRIAKYYALLERKPVVTFVELAAEYGRTPKQIRKDIKKARQKGWLKDVRMDEGETCLIRGEEAWQQYLDSQKTSQQRALEEAERQRRLEDPETADIESFKKEGIETIRQIRNANDAIPGEEISQKLSQLEATCARIFAYVEKHPEKLPETRKLVNYYLPTTLKLVEKYRQYEEMDFQPANVQKAKSDIEKTLDTIDVAFNNLLESLYQDDTLDVVTDIEVLEQMLEQEGLTGKRFEITETDGVHLTLDD